MPHCAERIELVVTDRTGTKFPRIWLAAELYWPEETSTGYFVTGIAEHLAADWRVGVFCGQPKYDQRGRRVPSRQTRNGVDIYRTTGTTLNRNILVFRVINVGSITLGMFWTAFRRIRSTDLVLVTTNPPALPFVVAIAARLRGARCVLLVQDLYPDVLVAAGLARANSLIVRLLSAASRRLYRSMDRICACGGDMATRVRERLPAGHGPDRVIVIPNWGDLDAVSPSALEDNALLRELALRDRFVVQYAGNAGPIHDVKTIIEAARQLRSSDPDVHFLFLGSGAKWRWLSSVVKLERLENVTVLAARPRADQQIFLNACHVAVSAFVPGMSGVGVPSRMYNIMAAGRPMIAAVDGDSEQATVIREEQVGWVVRPGDGSGLAAAIRAAKSNSTELAAMGHRARAAAAKKYDRKVVLEQYRRLVVSLMERDG
jgi:colanic acid biosynthesis glycosyl transferase WcaI